MLSQLFKCFNILDLERKMYLNDFTYHTTSPEYYGNNIYFCSFISICHYKKLIQYTYINWYTYLFILELKIKINQNLLAVNINKIN